MSSDVSEFLGFVRRILAAAARRCARADVEDLAELVALRGDVDRAIDHAVVSVHAGGASWEAIGRALGISRQSAHERWRRQVQPDRSTR